MEALQFLFQHLGIPLQQALNTTWSVEEMTGIKLPFTTTEKRDAHGNLKKAAAIESLRIGAKDVFVLCQASGSHLLGPVVIPSVPGLTIHGNVVGSVQRKLVELMLEMPEEPFLVGVFTKSEATRALRLSPHSRLGHFFQNGESFNFDLNLVKQTLALTQDFEWSTVRQALNAYTQFFFHEDEPSSQRHLEQFKKLTDKDAALAQLIPTLKIKPGSGEQYLVDWANRG
jgi:hypothetical protein